MAGTSSSPLYVATVTPTDPRQLPRYLTEELQKLQRVVQQLAAGHIDQVHVEPPKPRAGDMRLADGTDWDPGSGEGFYGYYGGAWHKLG